MRILAHICCAPCFTYPHKRLKEKGHDVTGFFYNPNIHPYTEYKLRMDSLEKFGEIKGARIIYKPDYDLETYLRGALDARDRCQFCYFTRLDETARTAARLGFEAFTTTLLISPYQKHEMLAHTGEKIADENSIEFYYEDFREGYKESREIARSLDLYMQKYCGCIFSEKERYFRK
ncbi:MAG TPA: epoxyqueuosine reductase QueH [Candidatus Methanoperedens sp.]|nr:epoxyqueuosine reductase QueH [Candidatus Methanoperedens sp.]HLB70669.1 epoxyqueuosine reductase QueH [Candidatus Methanoperedens sp.]